MATATSAMSLCHVILHIQGMLLNQSANFWGKSAAWVLDDWNMHFLGGRKKSKTSCPRDAKSDGSRCNYHMNCRNLGDEWWIVFFLCASAHLRRWLPSFKSKIKHRNLSEGFQFSGSKMCGITKAQLKEMMENEVQKLGRAECKIRWYFVSISTA